MENLEEIISTLKAFLYKKEEFSLFDILNNCKIETSLQRTFMGTSFYTLILNSDIDYFSQNYESNIFKEAEKEIHKYISDIIRGSNSNISSVVIRPEIKKYINWNDISDIYDKNSLIDDIDNLINILIRAATGENNNSFYQEYGDIYNNVNIALENLHLNNPNPYKTLFEANYFWVNNLNTNAEKCAFFQNMYEELLKKLKESEDYSTLSLHLEYTGWKEIDRKIAEIKKQFIEAENEEQFNAIGAICRSTYISLANNVFDENIHKTLDAKKASLTDYKRKLEAFINYRYTFRCK